MPPTVKVALVQNEMFIPPTSGCSQLVCRGGGLDAAATAECPASSRAAAAALWRGILGGGSEAVCVGPWAIRARAAPSALLRYSRCRGGATSTNEQRGRRARRSTGGRSLLMGDGREYAASVHRVRYGSQPQPPLDRSMIG